MIDFTYSSDSDLDATAGIRIAIHPHARGEHSTNIDLSTATSSSSPRPWGTLVACKCRWVGPRFIPTPVGNTGSSGSTVRSTPVHPHARGEHMPATHRRAGAGGSSPRPWGTRPAGGGNRNRRRFIPTPVGNTASPDRSAATKSVHPHARGEHDLMPARCTGRAGSSPRPWGTRVTGLLRVRPERFIPTPVGNTWGRPCRGSSGAVHPHARGEHLPDPAVVEALDGSSPRPWGTLYRQRLLLEGRRFIPTPVGNTPGLVRMSSRSTVHPHARGEHNGLTISSTTFSGSSPRPWGTRVLAAFYGLCQRFIPTPVGNTPEQCKLGWDNAVHPHARGEHQQLGAAMNSHDGSSPRPWGTRLPRPDGEGRARFIPTPVGNTLSYMCRMLSWSVHPHARGEHG